MLLLIGSVPAAEAAPLSEGEAVRLALGRPAVRDVMEGSAGIAEGEARGAGLWNNPVLSWTREQTFERPAGASEDVVALSQTFDLSGRRGIRSDAARLKALSAGSRLAAWTRDLRTEVRRRFYSVLLGQRRVEAARDLARRLADLSVIVARREAAGDISSYDRKRVQREHARARSLLDGETTTLTQAAAMLAALLGHEAPQGVHEPMVAGDLLPVSPPDPLEPLIENLKDMPAIRALEQEARALDLESRAARRGWVPDLTITAGYKTSAPANGRFHGYVVGASIPLPFVDREQGPAHVGEARARTIRGRLELETMEAQGEVAGLWRRSSLLVEAATRYRKDAMDLAMDLVGIAETAYAGGELGVLELLDAHRGLFEARSRTLEMEWKAREARIALDQLAGGDQ